MGPSPQALRARTCQSTGGVTRLREQHGQTAAEYLGILLVVAAVIGSIAALGIGGTVTCSIREAIASVTGTGAGCAKDAGSQAAQVQAGDQDGDGVSDERERRLGSKPDIPDSDGDGLADREELELGLDPTLDDRDDDGLDDGDELIAGTDPFVPDFDGDGEEDGEDGEPLSFDGNFGDGVAGAVCGGATTLLCPDENDVQRATPQYVTGEILTGIFAVGDVRDAVGALLDGKVGDALWSVAGVVPVAGDAVKIGRKIKSVIARFPARRGEMLNLLLRYFPEGGLKRTALDEATDGGYTALRNGGLSDEGIEQLARRGNDLRALADSARVGARSLDPAEARRLDDAVTRNWPPARRSEGLGVETALAELRRDPNLEILLDGRPRPGAPVNGPDIVAVDRTTGRPIVVEAKGTQGRRPLSGGTLRSTAGGRPVTQTSPDWLRNNPRRYLRALRESSDPGHRRAAEALQGIVRGDGYDVRIVNSRPTSQGGYGTRMDEAVRNIRGSGQVGNLEIVDVQRP